MFKFSRKVEIEQWVVFVALKYLSLDVIVNHLPIKYFNIMYSHYFSRVPYLTLTCSMKKKLVHCKKYDLRQNVYLFCYH